MNHKTFEVTWFCPCGKTHPLPSCQKCGDYADGWVALKNGWRVEVRSNTQNK